MWFSIILNLLRVAIKFEKLWSKITSKPLYPFASVTNVIAVVLQSLAVFYAWTSLIGTEYMAYSLGAIFGYFNFKSNIHNFALARRAHEELSQLSSSGLPRNYMHLCYFGGFNIGVSVIFIVLLAPGYAMVFFLYGFTLLLMLTEHTGGKTVWEKAKEAIKKFKIVTAPSSVPA